MYFNQSIDLVEPVWWPINLLIRHIFAITINSFKEDKDHRELGGTNRTKVTCKDHQWLAKNQHFMITKWDVQQFRSIYKQNIKYTYIYILIIIIIIIYCFIIMYIVGWLAIKWCGFHHHLYRASRQQNVGIPSDLKAHANCFLGKVLVDCVLQPRLLRWTLSMNFHRTIRTELSGTLGFSMYIIIFISVPPRRTPEMATRSARRGRCKGTGEAFVRVSANSMHTLYFAVGSPDGPFITT